MALEIEHDGSRFRVLSPGFSMEWLPDTASNRKSLVVFFRLLEDEHGKPLHTYQELAVLVASENRQASSGHVEEFRGCGEDMLAYLQRRRKVDGEVVDAVLSELLIEPLAGEHKLCAKVNTRLGRSDLNRTNIRAALEQISCSSVRGVLCKHLAGGKAHYQESYLLPGVLSSGRDDAHLLCRCW